MLKRQFKYAQSLSTLPALLAIGSFGQKKTLIWPTNVYTSCAATKIRGSNNFKLQLAAGVGRGLWQLYACVCIALN